MNTSKILLEEAYSNFKTRREHFQVSSAVEDMLEGGWSPALLLETIIEVIEEEITKLIIL